MKIWQLTPDQAEAWREIRLEALATAPDSYGTRLADWQHRPLADFAARLDQMPVYASGDDIARPLAVAGIDADDVSAERVWIISVYARPEGRGRGYAAAVIEHVCDLMRGIGKTEIGLNVGVHNIAARKLYERLGFAASGKPAAPNENGVPEMEMLRRLTPPPRHPPAALPGWRAAANTAQTITKPGPAKHGAAPRHLRSRL